MSIDDLIWLVASLVELAVIGMLIYRRVWRTLPVFFSYCVWDLTSNLAIYAIGRYYPGAVYHAYFAQTALDSALLFCVLVEMAWSVLRPLRASLPRSALVIVGILILVAGVAIWPFAALPGLAHATSKEGLLITQLQQTSTILRILFFLLLAGGSQLLSIGWRDRELQVATGLGLYSMVSLTVAVLDLHQTTASQVEHLNQIATGGYVFCLAYWVYSFAQKEAERREFTPQMRSFLLAAAGAARTTRVAMTDSRSDKPPKQDNR
ncbi:MAG: hypothetical protein ACLPLZ_02790 [Terracidiphilus sp.]